MKETIMTSFSQKKAIKQKDAPNIRNKLVKQTHAEVEISTKVGTQHY